MAEKFVSRGFVGRRRESGDRAARIPPGQYETRDFPVLSAGPTPRMPLETWTLSIVGLVGAEVQWTWDEFMALPQQNFTVDIHCVTKWTKLDTKWRGISVDTLFEHVELVADGLIELLGQVAPNQEGRDVVQHAFRQRHVGHPTGSMPRLYRVVSTAASPRLGSHPLSG